eukprot:TRINITY_DN2289_c0_g1_i3.p1 TRINITY_DN2289_c0_g1~~TRINITY_DN2289_c0_g1_i3.p1  ORF type:complete len:161 (-),score=22.27 TRINITY_DN2289_c0_g1_i3:2809-3291(-)
MSLMYWDQKSLNIVAPHSHLTLCGIVSLPHLFSNPVKYTLGVLLIQYIGDKNIQEKKGKVMYLSPPLPLSSPSLSPSPLSPSTFLISPSFFHLFIITSLPFFYSSHLTFNNSLTLLLITLTLPSIPLKLSSLFLLKTLLHFLFLPLFKLQIPLNIANRSW